MIKESKTKSTELEICPSKKTLAKAYELSLVSEVNLMNIVSTSVFSLVFVLARKVFGTAARAVTADKIRHISYVIQIRNKNIKASC